MTVTASSPQMAYETASLHVQSYLCQLKQTLVGMAIDDFCNTFSAQITKDTKELEGIALDLSNTLQLLEHTEKSIYLEDALVTQDEYTLMIMADSDLDLGKIQGKVIITRGLNPSYQVLLQRITDLEIQRITYERSIYQATKYLEELKAERQSLVQNSCADIGPFQSMSDLVTIISHPDEQPHKIGPRYNLILAAGLVIGLMLGVFVTLFVAYWKGVI